MVFISEVIWPGAKVKARFRAVVDTIQTMKNAVKNSLITRFLLDYMGVARPRTWIRVAGVKAHIMFTAATNTPVTDIRDNTFIILDHLARSLL
jgi:hypothetical protein